MRHHTKDKGDLGVACVIADLARHEIDVALPLSEHWPFDLLAISPDGRLAKVSVKYRTMSDAGTVRIVAKSCWADRHGTHSRPHSHGDYDAVAVYCPTTDRCYYVAARDLQSNATALRILDSRNGQKIGVRMAESFTDPFRMFAGPRSSAG
jgi:hypothetical protein